MDQEKNKSESGFKSNLGFILAAAGSAVGVGNIWRFPYLAAKDGGGLFLLIYLLLVFIFGFVLLASDLALGRKTKKHAVEVFGFLNKKWNFLGKLTILIPILIITYYPIVGGWFLKYSWDFLVGNGNQTISNNFFTTFLSSPYQSIFWTLIFFMITASITFFDVESGVERFSKIIMPGLLIIILGILFYSLGLKFTDKNNITRTAWDGLKIYLLPDFSNLSLKRLLEISLDAMSQLFFSLSVSMGIMITYGAYVKKNINLSKSIRQIELFDTGAALISGAIIIPAVYVFLGKDAMSQGPSLMFISLPKIFNTMGLAGQIIAVLFFLMVAFAALTSCISITETIIANFMQIFKWSRKKASVISSIFITFGLVIVCLGYNLFYFELKLPNGNTAQLLDLVDYVSNSFLMPMISFLTCVFIGWVIKPDFVIKEMEENNNNFRQKKAYAFIIKFVAPIVMLILFFESTGLLSYILKFV